MLLISIYVWVGFFCFVGCSFIISWYWFVVVVFFVLGFVWLIRLYLNTVLGFFLCWKNRFVWLSTYVFFMFFLL